MLAKHAIDARDYSGTHLGDEDHDEDFDTTVSQVPCTRHLVVDAHPFEENVS